MRGETCKKIQWKWVIFAPRPVWAWSPWLHHPKWRKLHHHPITPRPKWRGGCPTLRSINSSGASVPKLKIGRWEKPNNFGGGWGRGKLQVHVFLICFIRFVDKFYCSKLGTLSVLLLRCWVIIWLSIILYMNRVWRASRLQKTFATIVKRILVCWLNHFCQLVVVRFCFALLNISKFYFILILKFIFTFTIYIYVYIYLFKVWTLLELLNYIFICRNCIFFTFIIYLFKNWKRQHSRWIQGLLIQKVVIQTYKFKWDIKQKINSKSRKKCSIKITWKE